MYRKERTQTVNPSLVSISLRTAYMQSVKWKTCKFLFAIFKNLILKCKMKKTHFFPVHLGASAKAYSQFSRMKERQTLRTCRVISCELKRYKFRHLVSCINKNTFSIMTQVSDEIHRWPFCDEILGIRCRN